MITTLRIKKTYTDDISLAIKWFNIISILNDFKLSPIEIKMLAFAASEGNVSTGGKKEKFCSLFKSTNGSMDNTVSRLSKKGYLVKYEDKWIVHPQLKIDSKNDILVNLNLSHA